MNPKRTILFTAALCGLFFTSFASAQQADSNQQGEDLKQIQQELTKEIADLKTEMTALRTEFRSLRAELAKTAASLRSAQQARKPQPPRQRPAMTMVGKTGPEMTVTSTDGLKRTIGGKRDKPQVLFCYASWCGFCKKSLPWMETLHQKYKDKGVEVLALNLDDRGKGGRARTEEQSLSHYQGLKLTLPMTMTTATNDTKKIGAAYKASSFPTLFVLGTSGQVESVHVGARQGLEKIVGAQLDILLQGKTRADFPK